MSEKTLLQEVEKDQQKEIERKLASIKLVNKKEVKEEKVQDNRKTVFSSNAFPAEEVKKLKEKYSSVESQKELEKEQQEINQIESKVSQVIEKPNYDYMETLSEKQRKKIFSIKKEETPAANKPKKTKFKLIMVSILFAIFGVWGGVNITCINTASSQIAEVSTKYQLNLFNYLKNLYMLDATNSENMKNLFETIPEEGATANVLDEKSNWFDRVCNFLGGLFGG